MRLAVAMMLALLALGAQPATAAAQPGPDPGHSPGQVVGFVLEALAHPDRPRPDAGIELTFSFAAPSNKAQTGPLSRFKRLFANPLYAPLLRHQRAIRKPVRIEDDTARQHVTVITEAGNTAAYVFVLERQTQSPFEDCWMTTAVIRVKTKGFAT